MNGLPRLRPGLELLGDALWVRPAIAGIAGMGIGFLLPEIPLPADVPLTYDAAAGEARDTLQSIISVTLTVTATVFGFLIVALQVASTQFSPRSLRTFVRDRGTQNSLAVFLGVVAYASAVLLRTSDGRPDAPILAMTVAVALLLAVAGTVAFLIHHTAQSIRIEHLMQSITADTLAAIDAVASDVEGSVEPAVEGVPDVPEGAAVLPARKSGYIEEIDTDPLLRVAQHHDLMIALRLGVGEHIVTGLPLARGWRADGGDLTDESRRALAAALRRGISVGFERTMEQDIDFGARQLVDIGLRAISPAINDPRTAVEATNHLTRVLCALAQRPLVPGVARDAAGVVRVIVPRPSFEHYVALTCDELRRFGAQEPVVCAALLHMLEDVAQIGVPTARQELLLQHVDRIVESARRAVRLPADLTALEERAETARGVITGERSGRRGVPAP
jgi:uncharacterized membrane protein